jgi:putative CocE/NonD family hydrolase
MATIDAVNFFNAIRSQAQSESAREHTCLVVGPWEHGRPEESLGETFFGLTAMAQEWDSPICTSGSSGITYRGDPVPHPPAATYFLTGANVWNQATSWPPQGVEWMQLHLDSDAGAGGGAGSGALVLDPGADGMNGFIYDPHDPVPSYGGSYLRIGGSLAGPFDQRRIESRSDVLVYTTESLAEPLTVVGDAVVELHASSTAVDTDFVVKICDVDEEGVSRNISDGCFRARWREGFESPSWLERDRIYQFRIEAGPIGHVFLPGHCVRMQLTSSAFPGFERNMNTGHPEGEDAVGVAATQRIFHGPTNPSRLCLQIQPAEQPPQPALGSLNSKIP